MINFNFKLRWAELEDSSLAVGSCGRCNSRTEDPVWLRSAENRIRDWNWSRWIFRRRREKPAGTAAAGIRPKGRGRCCSDRSRNFRRKSNGPKDRWPVRRPDIRLMRRRCQIRSRARRANPCTLACNRRRKQLRRRPDWPQSAAAAAAAASVGVGADVGGGKEPSDRPTEAKTIGANSIRWQPQRTPEPPPPERPAVNRWPPTTTKAKRNCFRMASYWPANCAHCRCCTNWMKPERWSSTTWPLMIGSKRS